MLLGGILTMTLILAILLGGSLLLWQARRSQQDARRKTSFVANVSHELKTPLTNIRMYIERLEQGIAKDKAREQEYFHILGSESARLSGLINNVLELSKLEKKQRHVDVQEGNFEGVFDEMQQTNRIKEILRGMPTPKT